MEIKDYCANVTAELTGWKDKVEGVVRKLDHASPGGRIVAMSFCEPRSCRLQLSS